MTTNVGSNVLPATPVDAALPALVGDNPASPSGTTPAAASTIGPLPAMVVQPRQAAPLSGPVTQAMVDSALASMQTLPLAMRSPSSQRTVRNRRSGPRYERAFARPRLKAGPTPQSTRYSSEMNWPA